MKKYIAFAFFFFVSYSLHAQSSPRVLSYQGVVRSNESGFNGNHSLTITLYGNVGGTVKLWQGTINTPVDSSGVFNCLLGTQDNPLPSSTVMDQPLWLGVAVDSSPELRPLSQMTASPYALNVADNSITTAKLADSSVTNSKIAENAITWDKMGTEYVPYLRVNGAKVTTGHNSINFTGSEGLLVDYDSTSMSLIFRPDTSLLSGINGKGGINTLGVIDEVALTDGTHSSFLGYYDATTTDILHGGTPPTYSKVNLTTDVSGILPFANGGTGNIPKWVGGVGTANVATGAFTTVSGGDSNTAYGNYSDVGGGHGNYAGYWTSVTGGFENKATGNYEFIGAGENNSIDGSNSGAIVAGYSNKITNADYNAHFIGSGHNNLIEDDGTGEIDASAIVGGIGNAIYEGPSFIGGGQNNVITQEWVSIVGGVNNVDSSDISFIGGGADNEILGADDTLPYPVAGMADDTFGIMTSAIVAGFQNLINLGGFDFIGAGWRNTTTGEFSAIPGGYGLKLGAFSFGFNGESPQFDTAVTNLSNTGAGLSQVAYFGNVNMMLGNVDGSARALQFYSPQTNHSYSGAKYSSFQAGSQTSNIVYTLPTVLPIAGQFLKTDTVFGNNVGLVWAYTPSDTVIDTGGGGGTVIDTITVGGNFWKLTGNSGTNPPTNFIGTLDNKSFEIHLYDSVSATGGNKRVMQYSLGATSPNILGGSSANVLGGGLSGSAILSGGTIAMPNLIDSGAPFSMIGSGIGNHISGSGLLAGYDVIGGGRDNFMGADTFRSGFNVIGGGDSNLVGWGSYGNVIAGGKDNLNANAYGTISGGIGNLLNGPGGLNVVGGGSYNTVGGDISVSAGYITASAILGGDSNMIRQYASYAAIVGGSHNSIDSADSYSTIGGGENNKIDVSSPSSTISGGSGNYIRAIKIIHGDSHDTIPGIADVIAGGDSNQVFGSYSSISGGQKNVITGYGLYASIPGGIGLTASSYAQTVLGSYNVVNDETFPPLLVVGNGQLGDSSNAFTVSYAGSASAYDSIPKGFGTSMGTMYTNNTIEAWGNVHAGDSATFDDIGVLRVVHDSMGSYTIILNVVNQDGSLHTFTQGHGAITASIGLNLAGGPGFIAVSELLTMGGDGISPITPGFRVNTFNITGTTPSNGYPFQFHVVTR